MSDDIVARLKRQSVSRVFASKQLIDGTMIWHPMMLEAADEITRLRAENEKLREECQKLKDELAKWANYWRDKDVKALSAENERLREALKPFVRRLEVLEEIRAHKYATATNIDVIHLRAARAAIEGVLNKSGE